ncbi:MAG TPA: hypothetical protein VFY83_14920 [Anaerolineales bacterium]|nr:hypothetical protein [Anaerolineales bacterium]
MQPRPSFDPEFLIILAISVVSILGLGWIFLTNYRGEAPIPPTAEPTAIPFEVTPPRTRTLRPPPSATPTLEETPASPTATSPAAYPGPPAETLPAEGTLIAESQPDPSATPARDPVQPLPAGKHDNTNPNIVYDRYWAFKMNPGTKYAYKGTLHISTSIGNEVSFSFTGQRFYLGYQRGRNFGTVTVVIDGQTYSFHEQAFGNIWRSPELPPGTYSVRLIHENGESINLDYIEVVP